MLDPRRIGEIVQYALDHFDQKTKRQIPYEHTVVTNVVASYRSRGRAEVRHEHKRVRGFNAIFATASIEAARMYYNKFRMKQQELPPDKQLKIAIIYSYGANEAQADGIVDDEAFDTDGLNSDARSFLEDAIQDYNDLFGTSYDTSADKFQNYYKDLSQRLKNRELDLVIVVNMFLTGFDATTLNILFVDKDLRAHGLLQAYSRTNRILNSVKNCGNIVAFRNLEKATNHALELFGNKEARGVVIMKPYSEYYADYADKVHKLLEGFPLGVPIMGEDAQKQFINLFGNILRLENILTVFDEFADNQILTERQRQDYQSLYLDLYAEHRRQEESDKAIINDELVFEIELIKQVEINVDYILMLVESYRAHIGDGKDKEIRQTLFRAVDASPTLRDKRDLIEKFLDHVGFDQIHLLGTAIDEEWQAFITARRDEELAVIIAEENLKAERTCEFIERAFRNGVLQTNGTAIIRLMPSVSRFAATDGLIERKQRVIQKLTAFFFDRFHAPLSGHGELD